jgi:glycine cleavage system H protein
MDDLRFATTDEWVRIEGDVATIGITDFAIKALTDLVHIELPEVGGTINKGDVLGEVESVKAVSDLYAPVSGTIVEVNEGLVDDLDALSEEPFGRGWIVKIRMSNPDDTNALIDRAAYEAHWNAEH